MKIEKVNLKEKSYNIYIGYNLSQKISTYLKALNLGNLAIILSSPAITRRYKSRIRAIFKGFNYKIVEVADREAAKSKKWLLYAIEEMMKADAWNKKIFIVCFGGGSIGDLGGFIASIYKRGTPYIQIPTTLLSQIDASIGGKTAINLDQAKNILGTFYQPRAVFIDPLFLNTLGQNEIKQGIAEAIKYGAIKDKKLFSFLKKNHREIARLKPSCILKLISACVRIKARIVEEDEQENKGVRTILNFGHTLAHALETSKKYRRLSHGEAVSLGMLYAAWLSYELKVCPRKVLQEIYDTLRIFRLPTRFSFDYLTVYKAMSYDKKFISAKFRLVLVRAIGRVTVVEGIVPKKILQSLKKFSAFN